MYLYRYTPTNEVHTPRMEQSDWSKCYNYGTNMFIACTLLVQVSLKVCYCRNIVCMYNNIICMWGRGDWLHGNDLKKQ